MRISVKDNRTQPPRYFFIDQPISWVKRHDNGCLVSIGLTVPVDLSPRAFDRLKKTEITYSAWNHSGCLSSCVMRGRDTCRW